MNPTRAFVLLIASAALSQSVRADTCATSAALLGLPPTAIDGCVCDAALANLQASPTPPLKLAAACGLRWPAGGSIDLRTKRVSLDQYTDGNLPFGIVYFRGRVELTGTLRYEPGYSSDAWFAPRPSLVDERNPALRAELHSLKVIGDEQVAKFHAPAKLRESGCFTADATIVVDGIRLIIGGTDEAGAYPIRFEVLKVANFAVCQQ